MRITLHLSGGLRAVLNHLPGEMTIELKGTAPVRAVLERTGINPLLVMMVTVDGETADKDQMLDHDAEVVVVGPVAGG